MLTKKTQKAGAKFTTKKQNSQFHIGLPNNHCVHTRDTLFVAAGCFQSARTRYSWLSFYTVNDHSGSSVVHVTDCMLVGSVGRVSLHKARAQSLASRFPAPSTTGRVPADHVATGDGMFFPRHATTLKHLCVIH